MERLDASGRVGRQGVITAFKDVCQGFSPDRVVADPDLNANFIQRCEELGLVDSPAELNRVLLNLRKAGDLAGLESERTTFDDDQYRFAAEIAIRILERRNQITLDEVLCDPALASEFDQLASALAPGFSALEYRWAALSLRKSRSLKPEVASRLLPPEQVRLIPLVELRIDEVPRLPGLYAFIDTESKLTIYVGEASNLRTRLATHFEHSDNKQLARHLWEHGPERISVEFYVLPEGISKRDLRAIEIEQIRQRNPPFNIAGRE